MMASDSPDWLHDTTETQEKIFRNAVEAALRYKIDVEKIVMEEIIRNIIK